MNKIEQIKRAVEEKRLVKIIAGIDNFDAEKVKQIISAAEKGGADAVDICADENIIEMVLETTNLPVFVSSIVPEELAKAVRLGVDAVEIGNFDALYKKGMRISAAEVLEIAEKTIALCEREVFISVTVPGHLEVSEQIDLARNLENLGVDLIQTEGSATFTVQDNGAKGLMQQAHVSIANTIELVRNVNIPVMTASGITSTTVAMVFAAGASAVGIGSFVNKLGSALEMTAAVMSVVSAVNRNASSEDRLYVS